MLATGCGLNVIRRGGSSAAFVVVALWLGACPAGDRLILIENSPGLSQATDLNIHGHIIGMKDVKTRLGYEQRPFFWDGGERALSHGPKGLGFTTVYPESLSDTGFVVGYASRGIGDGRGATEACLWDTNADVSGSDDSGKNSFVRLGRLKTHRGSHAFDISDDGNVVVGFSAGPDPPTMVPVVWTRRDDGWEIERLPTVLDINPYLQIGRVVVSGDGTAIAACISVRAIPGPFMTQYESSTFGWRKGTDGKWQLKELSEHQLRMGDINNSGTLVGSVLEKDRRRAYVISSTGEFSILEPLDPDDDAGATDINNTGVVVGYCDNPRSETGVPRAFVYRGNSDNGGKHSKGKVEPLTIPQDPLLSWATAINEAGDVAGYLAVRPKSPVAGSGPGQGSGLDVAKAGVAEVGRTVPFVLRAIENAHSDVRDRASAKSSDQ